ncbi:MAG: pentapeptide repeat-containing protein [Cyclobacteriaceae bacterium]|nr:pentapeptide repeat-containing protein [Cyclobacteriaceae bacterium]
MVILKNTGEVLEVPGNTLRGVNLSGKDLSGAELCCADLTGANLSGSKSTHAKFNHSKLCGADLSGSSLDFTEFSAVDFTGANWSGTILDGCCKVQDLIGMVLLSSVGVFETKSIEQWICFAAGIDYDKHNPYLTRLNATRVLLKNGITIMPDWHGGHDKAHAWMCQHHAYSFQAN